jgi:hypothetical protein
MKITALAALCAASLLATTANATSITPGTTLTGLSVPGTTSVYQIFGHIGNPGGDYGPSTDAVELNFAAGASNVFTFTVRGLVSCCSDGPNIPPDGGGSGMNVVGANGLSGLIGNAHIPFVGVFTAETDPFGSSAPSSLSFDAGSPGSPPLELQQVFYIGDGKSGFNDGAGTTLSFMAPAGATRLYLGVIDAFGFNAVTGYYADNNGAFTANVSLSAVPLPAAVWLLGGALGGLGAIRRRST